VAVSIVKPALTRGQALTVARLVGRVLRDSNRTLDIVEAEEILGQSQLRYLVREGVFETGEGRDLVRDRPHLADTDTAMLRALPPGTLGREWIDFCDRHGLDLSVTRQPTPHTRGELETYLLQRIRQSHDLWHQLLGLGVKGHEEVLVHAFSLAQTGLPSSIGIAFFGAIKHMVLERRWGCLRRDLRRAYRIGERAEPLLAVYWERYFERPIDEVRARFNVEPV
jgi:ubiquinone biosynthesis protein COQ4